MCLGSASSAAAGWQGSALTPACGGAGADTPAARFFINCLAETPETVAAHLVPRIRAVPRDSRTLGGGISQARPLPRFVSQDMCSGLHSCSWHQPNMSQASACHVLRAASCVLQDVKVACMRDGACTEPQRGSAAAPYRHHCCRHCCKVSL